MKHVCYLSFWNTAVIECEDENMRNCIYLLFFMDVKLGLLISVKNRDCICLRCLHCLVEYSS